MRGEVQVSANLFDWFHQRIADAHGLVGARLSKESDLYLTALLVDRARSDRDQRPETTLAELHARAANEPPAAQLRTYRELGDRSLYRVGYFEESLSRGTVSSAYYCEMGAAAYGRVDQGFKRWFSNAFDGVFDELARKFSDCVNVLREVRRTTDDEPDVWMRMFQQWRETGDEDLAERLRAHGLVLPPRSSDT